MEKIDLLRNLVSFNTISDKENQEILDFIEEFLTNLGFVTEEKKKYLIMSYGDDPSLGFIGHSDTVEFVDGWDSDPHTLTEKDGMLYGLGACDMKGGIASFLMALQNTDLKRIKKGIKVYITYDEEKELTGIKEIVSTGEQFPEYTIFGEPTNNVTFTACKGLFSFTLRTKGIKVHSSTPNKGRSAISSMLKILTELEEFYANSIQVEKNDLYEVPYTTMNIGLISGGSAVNSVAAECSSYVDFRIVDADHITRIKEKLEELCSKNYGSYEVDLEIPSFENDIEFIPEKKSAGYMTEASFVSHSKRMILGPGPETPHEINEHISIESYTKTIEQYQNLIEKICK